MAGGRLSTGRSRGECRLSICERGDVILPDITGDGLGITIGEDLGDGRPGEILLEGDW